MAVRPCDPKIQINVLPLNEIKNIYFRLHCGKNLVLLNSEKSNICLT
jgi:hypothetical protein